MKAKNTLKHAGYTITNAGKRWRGAQLVPVVLIMSSSGGYSLDGDKRQRGREIKAIAREVAVK